MNNDALLDLRRTNRQTARQPAMFALPPAVTPAVMPAGVVPGGLDESRFDSSGTALPVGAAVAGGPPGLFMSARGPAPLGRDPVAAAVEPGSGPEYGYGAATPPPSRFTLRQAPAAAAPALMTGARPAADAVSFRTSATNLALQRILGTPGANGGGVGLGAGVGVPPLLAAASGLEGTRLNLAADDMATRLRANVPTAGQPAGFRDSNALYMQKLITDQAARDPMLAPGGRPPTVEEMAAAGRQLQMNSSMPRLITVGMDEAGKPIQRIYNPRTGNDEKMPASRPAKSADVERSTDGMFYRSGPEDPWKPLPRSHMGDTPLTLNEWFTANSPMGNYQAYRDAFEKEHKAALAAEAAAGKKPAQATESVAGKPAAAAQTGPTPDDQAALDWLKNNPNHSAAAGVRARLQKQGHLK